MATEIIMPKAGMAMEEGKIIQWMKSVGDKVEIGDVILEIETDKVAMEVEAETSGYLIGILHEEGATVPVIQPIGWIGEKGEKPPVVSPYTSSPVIDDRSAAENAPIEPHKEVPAPVTAVGNPAKGPRPKASPAARKKAADLGVDLDRIAGTGPAGETTIRDVENATSVGPQRISPLAEQDARSLVVDPALISGSGNGGRVLRRDVAEQGSIHRNLARMSEEGWLEPSSTPVWQTEEDSVAKASGIRIATAKKMLESHLANPPVTMNCQADVTKLIALREEINMLGNKNGASKLSLNVFLMKAAAQAARKCPWMRSSISGDTIIEHAHVNLGMAVATSAGLMVPVIADADTLSLSRLNEVSRDLAERTKARKVGLDEMSGATFSVSNLGMYGITHFTPIINPPESAILGIGTIKKELQLDENGSPVEKALLFLSLTIDHKLIDGAQGAVFIQTLTDLLEEPLQLML